ncbi:MAG: xanthine dehydrogenase accessory protein XdhC [Paracoccus sp. (in: a-proteobacteria)]|uniref:xanthine dehydrogenase accessory protein XdhC n=1 Tax=Paracoccus sp. TaxID=267 RepID=UPI0026E071A9|nr:xanthine dehydrogenase accessory protein XdhC [Paracoccus sp. (in: a-proteobacteria)]MDO5611736.1 xanthine dehydrogenase accessory protein XdhC [Paracoccus sp. (in: a-proteobacteria)]
MIRVRIEAAQGSTPREAGAAMTVTADATQGSIGGGALEYMAIDRARQMLVHGEARARMDVPLGPEIGQCCGGRVTLSLAAVQAMPPEPPRPDVLIFGAGHVGRALARALALLPLAPLLIDSRAGELARAPGLSARLTPLPEAEIRAARPGSAVVIVTHDHALDFLLAAEALARDDLPYIGMIGSATKRAQFTRFARARGLDPARLICPIGAGGPPDKRPEVIAAMTAAEIIATLTISCPKAYPCDI